ncbi:S26 family signal peptidase [Brevibacillus reuszeri]|uniref:Signal peptidase I n=1 Tax=Brevibacillus reuszeri TaxID=54915 RepID=A0A0K9YMA8_9BACL|nr:signal peptidase I [Brevibacillus reuszeri]KNB69330.1 signal peptidase [Brevibacillus reuszeri]MED1860371.1 signal peptidase I [Brevibacillus reuszeri]GED70742.1 S26 family signal peptidase [Brevibacillus reuszeri]
MKIIKEWGPSLLIAIVASLTIRTFVAEAMVVPTGSMLPTIQINDRLIVEKIIKMDEYKFGDIVVFYPPVPEKVHERYVKRLIGLPGDVIEIKNGSLIRNGVKLSETYLNEPIRYEYGPITVPENKYFFLGDNRNESFDSHLWTTPFVDKEKVIGKAILTIPTHLIDKRDLR